MKVFPLPWSRLIKPAYIVLLTSLSLFSLANDDLLDGRPQKEEKIGHAIERVKGYRTSFNIGLGIGEQTKLYRGGNPRIPVVPIVGFKYKNFYGYGITLGYTFFWGWPTLSLALTPELISLSPEENSFSQGLNKRKFTINAGLKAIFPTRFLIGTLDIFHDTLGRYDGFKVGFDLNKPIKVNKKFKVLLGLGATWVSREYTNYYFGVSPAETANSPAQYSIKAYSPKDSFLTKAQLVLIYELTDKLSFVLLDEYTRLPSEIHESPLVAKDYLNRLYATITYSF